MSQPTASPPIRLVMRLLLEFLVAAMPGLARCYGRDLVRGVVFLAIVQANRPRFSDQGRAGILPWTRSDAALRPISVLAISESLKLPYETTRRRILRLIDDGCVHRSADGLIVPNAVLEGEAFQTFANETYALFLRMLRGLKAIGFDFDSFARGEISEAPAEPEEKPDLAVRHVIIDFLLRMTECGLQAHEDDMLRALLFAAVMSANAEPYTADPHAAWEYATLARSPPEEKRKPITVAELSLRTGIPRETARRYVAAMLKDKDIVRVGRSGVINPQVSPRDARLHQSGALVMTRFVQFIGDLRRLGFDFTHLEVLARSTAA